MDKLFQDAEYRPADYEAQAGRYSYRVGRRIYRRWDCIFRPTGRIHERVIQGGNHG